MKSPYPCPECEGGTVHAIVEDYKLITSDGNTVVVPNVDLARCDGCGLTLVSAKSSRYISEFQAQAQEQLSKAELFKYLEASELNQKDYAEALGLGEKTFHRWLKGTQVVSRSMGYYLRAMHHFPEVFAWVKNREWRTPKRTPVKRRDPNEPVFVALSRRQAATVVVFAHNPAQHFALGTVHLRQGI